MTCSGSQLVRFLFLAWAPARLLGAGLIGAGLLVAPARAQNDPATPLQGIIVLSTSLRPADHFEAPASISVVSLGDDVPASVSAALAGVPGLLARERQNPAQDTQLSIRGFGARSTFGVRGLRLYADGIPATMPDGQGQISHFNLLAGDRIEVLRGPFSALYGNSSGGVVQIVSADGAGPLQLRAQASVGSYGSIASGVSVRGGSERMGYSVAASVTDSDGYRDHSASRRESFNAKLRFAMGEDGTLSLVANRFHSPDAQDPLGLTRAEALADPRQATTVAYLFDTRKSATQNQLGAVMEQALGGGHAVRAMTYAGHREIEQFLALPVAAQANPLNAGGVIDLGSDYGGADLRWTWRDDVASGTVELTAGVSADTQRQQRRGFENFAASTLGVRGALRRDERNTARNRDVFAQGFWEFAPRWSLLAGARRSDIRYVSDDRYMVAANPDDSGAADYGQTTPVAGLMFAPRDDWRIHVSAGRGFETPTFNELGYRADGAAGLALDLRPARSVNMELGSKWRGNRGAMLEAALFRADTADELAVARNVGGRSSFRNVGRARREGLEVAGLLPLGAAWQIDLAFTHLRARFRDTFPICVAAGCTTPNTLVPAGTRIPGVPRDQLASRLHWRGGRWAAGAQAVAVGEVTVNDSGSQRAPGYGVLNLDLGRNWSIGRSRVHAFARVDNAFDRRHIGSVIVNEGNGRFYEPGPDRTWSIGLRWDHGE